MNEWMAQRYQQTGHLPSGAERLDYLKQTAADKRMQGLTAALDPRQGAQADDSSNPDAQDETPWYNPQALAAINANLKDLGLTPGFHPPQQHQGFLADPAAIQQAIAANLGVRQPTAGNGNPSASPANQKQPQNGQQPARHSVMDPLTIAGGLSQLNGNVMDGQPTAYEQAKSLGLQTGPTKTSEMYGAGNAGGPSQQPQAAPSPSNLGFWESLLHPDADNANPTVKTLKQISDAFQKYNPNSLAANWLIAQPLQAVKSLYLNGLAAATQAAEGKSATFTPNMTYGQYTAKAADAMGSPDYFQQTKDYFGGDQYKKQLAQALGVSPDSALVNNISAAQVYLINTAGEAAADPTSYLGIGEAQALARGNQALKIGDLGYEAALRANKVNGGLKPFDKGLAWLDEEAQVRLATLDKAKAQEARMQGPAGAEGFDPAQLAQDATQGYTQGGGRAGEEALNQGVNGTEESLKPNDITSIYRGVGPNEYYNVMGSGKFDTVPTGMEVKQFGLGLQDTINFAERYPNIAAVLEVKIPKSILDKIGDFTRVDTRIFKNGTVTIQPNNLDTFNEYIKEILHVY